MKVLHTIHPHGEYAGTGMQQNVHEVDHTDITRFYRDFNQIDECEQTFGGDTIVTAHGIFTTAADLVESYVIIG